MSTGLPALYRELVLEHNKNPRCRGALPSPDSRCVGDNPLCGDKLVLDMNFAGERIAAIGYEVEASALTVAMASILAGVCLGQRRSDARDLASALLSALDDHGVALDQPLLEPFAPLVALRDYPNRRKSLTLAPATFLAALAEQAHVTTEA